MLFRPARPVQHLTSAAGLLDATFTSAKRAAQREAAAQRAARALVEHPVVYYAQVEPEVAEALRQPDGVAENLARLTGLAVERRAEGVLLADAGGRFTDRPFPGRGGAVNRAAGLLLAKIADVLEDPDERAVPAAAPAGSRRPARPAGKDRRRPPAGRGRHRAGLDRARWRKRLTPSEDAAPPVPATRTRAAPSPAARVPRRIRVSRGMPQERGAGRRCSRSSPTAGCTP